MVALRKWANRQATLDWLRAQIAKNNYLDQYFENGMIPLAMMTEILRNTGWRQIAK